MGNRVTRICVISNYYPTDIDPIYSFVDEVVSGFVDQGIECFVISPQSVWEREHKAHTRVKQTKGGNELKIFCPKYLTLSNKRIGGLDCQKIAVENYCAAAYKSFKKYVGNCDLIYGHFLRMSGIAAGYIAQKENIPCVVACGESSFDASLSLYRQFSDALSGVRGVICVSSEIKRELEGLSVLHGLKAVEVIPNGVDLDKFHKKDMIDTRHKLGIPEDKFIISFVGHFIDRKGIRKVINAVNKIDGCYGIFIGGSELPEQCDKALFVGKVSHDKLGDYYSASDTFVLPTLAEGCCNSIIEAQGCCLPIITSDRPFNADIVDNESALLVDPESDEQIIKAVRTLMESKQDRERLSSWSEKKSQERDIRTRVNRIIDFINRVVEA